MDLTGVDVTDAPGARRGAEVTVFGGQTDGAMRAEEVAELLDTIGYEVVVSVSPRVPRVYREAPERP